MMTEVKSVQKFWLEREEEFFKDNQQKTYDNETGEHKSGQGPIFIQDWQVHLGNKEYGHDKWVRDVGVCAQACKRRTKSQGQ